MNKSLLTITNLIRTYQQGDNRLEVLKGINLQINPGQLVALVGPSGSGKSTLLHTTGLLEAADQGDIIIDGQQCARLDDDKRTAIRRDVLGFVYQFHHLLPEFSAEENVILPQMIHGTPLDKATARAKELLKRVGLEERADHRPARLSGGEQQRVAIIRALANSPKILLADEPTGNLDETTAAEVFDYLVQLVREEKLAALIATHNTELAHKMDRVVTLQNGKLLELKETA